MRKIYLMVFVAAVIGALLGSGLMFAWFNATHPLNVNAGSISAAVRITDASDAITIAAEKIGPAVVNIDTKQYVRVQRFGGFPMDDFFRRFFGENSPFEEYGAQIIPRQGKGSGVIVNADGYILTNEHVVSGAAEITVTLTDKRQFKGKVVGSDRISDIAIVKIHAKDLPVAELGNSDALRIGQCVIAVGNPYGFDHTVTMGVLSGRQRKLSDGSKEYQDLLQTDAAINPGNSGGPLCDLAGRVIGINTAIIPFAQGIGFAIPINTAKNVMEQLIAKGKVVRPYLGIYMQEMTKEIAEYLHAPTTEGVLVTNVVSGSPAERANLRKMDIIVEIDRQKISSPEDVRKIVQGHKIGDKVVIVVQREGGTQILTATIGEMP